MTSDLVARLCARKEPTIEVDMHYPQIVDSDTPDADCLDAAARIERLEAALRGVMQEAERHHAENITRAELGGSDMAQRKAKAIVSRSGVLLHSIKGIARAALEDRT